MRTFDEVRGPESPTGDGDHWYGMKTRENGKLVYAEDLPIYVHDHRTIFTQCRPSAWLPNRQEYFRIYNHCVVSALECMPRPVALAIRCPLNVD